MCFCLADTFKKYVDEVVCRCKGTYFYSNDTSGNMSNTIRFFGNAEKSGILTKKGSEKEGWESIKLAPAVKAEAR